MSTYTTGVAKIPASVIYYDQSEESKDYLEYTLANEGHGLLGYSWPSGVCTKLVIVGDEIYAISEDELNRINRSVKPDGFFKKLLRKFKILSTPTTSLYVHANNPAAKTHNMQFTYADKAVIQNAFEGFGGQRLLVLEPEQMSDVLPEYENGVFFIVMGKNGSFSYYTEEIVYLRNTINNLA